jgi:glycosyltransferase involved in cell wall biosynthesis
MPIKIIQTKEAPTISIIIPSRDGDRRGNVAKLLTDLNNQTYTDFEIILVIAESPNGHARNVGVTKAKGTYYLFIDDDAILGSNDMLETTMNEFEKDTKEEYGLIGCATLIPLDSNNFQKWNAREIERSEFPPVDKLTESDMVHHLFCATRAKTWHAIDGENSNLETGTDMDLRSKLRQKNLKIAVAPHIFAYHPLPGTLFKFIKQNFWYGSGIPILRVYWPESIQITSKKEALVWAMKYILLFPIMLFKQNKKAPIQFKPLNAIGKVTREIGYSWGYFKYSKRLKKLYENSN